MKMFKSLKIFISVTSILLLVFSSKISNADDSSLLVNLNNVEQYFIELDIANYRVAVENVSNNPLCKSGSKDVIVLPDEKVEEYVLAGLRDKLTVIRLFKELAVRVNELGLSLCGNGDALNDIIERNKIELGLSLPMTHMAFYAWELYKSEAGVESTVKLKLLYRNSYIHKFAEETLPADLEIGTDHEINFNDVGINRVGKLVDMDVFYSDVRFGFRNISGVAARPHGIMGFFLDIFFFLPDAVHGMYVENDRLVTEALITTYVNAFETTPKYQMRIIN